MQRNDNTIIINNDHVQEYPMIPHSGILSHTRSLVRAQTCTGIDRHYFACQSQYKNELWSWDVAIAYNLNINLCMSSSEDQ